ncbi:unnamed protein product [Thelazia callipaeda]|uniref:Clc-like protein n=1 Tax=Thelazia callipaeda TaxID=103827 RepID=A0A158RAX6_THECL|nr:unnamed protein product [Thelazia callipaeda]
MRSFDNESSTIVSESFLEKQPSLGTVQKPPTSSRQCSPILRIFVIFITSLFIVAGIALTIRAITLPSWQVVHLFEYNSVHEHGLWLDCTRHSREERPILRRYYTESEPLNCVYKWDYDDSTRSVIESSDDTNPVSEVNRHRFYGWQMATLILLALAILTSVVSLFIACCSYTYRFLALIFTTTTLLNFFLTAIAGGVFFFYSHRADNRFINGIVGTYEQRVGLAFYLELAACLSHFLAFLLSILFAFLSLSNAPAKQQYGSNLNQTTNTIPSSLVYHGNKDAIIRTPPQYTNYEMSYSKLPTSSLQDISTPILRRGSETCV